MFTRSSKGGEAQLNNARDDRDVQEQEMELQTATPHGTEDVEMQGRTSNSQMY